MIKYTRLILTVIFNIFSHPCVPIVALSDVWAGTVMNILAEVLTISARGLTNTLANVGNMVTVSGMIILSSIVLAVLELTMATSSEKSARLCSTACSCWPITGSDCSRTLHAWMPSDHVWSSFVLLYPPQLPNHEPPRPQQLFLPDLSIVPQSRHTELVVLVVAAGVYM